MSIGEIIVSVFLIFAAPVVAQAQGMSAHEAHTYAAQKTARIIMYAKVCGGDVPKADLTEDWMDDTMRRYVQRAVNELDVQQRRVGKLVFCAHLAEWWREDSRKPRLD
jgi:hypothetical protein